MFFVIFVTIIVPGNEKSRGFVKLFIKIKGNGGEENEKI
jgi:hypothetical protein